MKVFLSTVAASKLESLLSYLEVEWSTSAKSDFLLKFKKSVDTVKRFPQAHPESLSRPNLYKCVVTHQTSFYYRIKDDTIEIIAIIDNRQNPDSFDSKL